MPVPPIGDRPPPNVLDGQGRLVGSMDLRAVFPVEAQAELKALFGTEDPSHPGVAAHLARDGRIAVEIGHTQKADVTAIFEAAGFGLTEARRDLGERDRVLVFAAQGRIAAPPK